MYIVIGLGLVVFIIAIICAIVVISLYNTLVHLQKTCLSTLDTLFTTWEKKSETLADSLLNEHISHCLNAKTIESKVKSFNTLVQYSQGVSSSDALGKKIKAIDASLRTEKRFFSNTARELNDRLVSFPTNLLGSMLQLKQIPLIELTPEENNGILPEAKYL